MDEVVSGGLRALSWHGSHLWVRILIFGRVCSNMKLLLLYYLVDFHSICYFQIHSIISLLHFMHVIDWKLLFKTRTFLAYSLHICLMPYSGPNLLWKVEQLFQEWTVLAAGCSSSWLFHQLAVPATSCSSSFLLRRLAVPQKYYSLGIFVLLKVVLNKFLVDIIFTLCWLNVIYIHA